MKLIIVTFLSIKWIQAWNSLSHQRLHFEVNYL